MPNLPQSAAVAVLLARFCLAAPPPPTTKVDVKDSKGNMVGTATFRAEGKGTRVTLDLHDMPAGVHGVHIHEAGRCDTPDFASAGKHFNAESKQHGRLNPNGFHTGDMDNITVKADGTVHAGLLAADAHYADASDPASIFHTGGASLVIHAGEDDLKSDPAGNSGARIACAVISK